MFLLEKTYHIVSCSLIFKWFLLKNDYKKKDNVYSVNRLKFRLVNIVLEGIVPGAWV